VPGQVDGIDETRIFVRVPTGTDCDVTIETGTTTGLLLTRQPDGMWFASACSIATPGELVAAGGEPRGGAIKVVLGLVILAIVLSWALRRRARGVRPNLPGAPEP
jgi:MYXO-CTERM domain-containing protein